MADQRVNEFQEPILMPPTFEHPATGKFKDQPEEFFLGKAVRLYVDIEDPMSGPKRAAVWLDVLRFEDTVVEGSPVRVGIGRAQNAATGTFGCSVREGMELAFAPAEIFDAIEASGAHMEPGGVYLPVAAAS